MGVSAVSVLLAPLSQTNISFIVVNTKNLVILAMIAQT
jgi:hypothetical protein